MFLQKLVTVEGDERLVIVYAMMNTPSAGARLHLVCRAFGLRDYHWALIGHRQPPAIDPDVEGTDLELQLRPGEVFTLRGGSGDPADRSHVHFDCDINGVPYAIDGHLIDAEPGMRGDRRAGVVFDLHAPLFHNHLWGSDEVPPKKKAEP